MPKGSPKREKNAINTIPRMISGIIKGRIEMYSITPLVFQWILERPTAPRVPIPADRRQLSTPRIRLFPKASIISLSAKSSSYHRKENPVRATGSFDSLNENRMTTPMGRYIRKNMIPR